MDKIILNIKDEFEEGDILIYKKGKLQPVSADSLTKDIYAKLGCITAVLDTHEEKLKRIKDVIDLILKEQE